MRLATHRDADAAVEMLTAHFLKTAEVVRSILDPPGTKPGGNAPGKPQRRTRGRKP